ncbi:cell division protein FtsB [Wenzhouxiangella limi]|uniref:Cell division protein FtsB n=1 Tax=Wenzhouxiangella limi TaxID=2707351 RepID=A0A845VFX1_9GAMM|nr:cell division protein FtsB [Wenzhouxiangella limi]NDY96119.1 cell division protein FtsB [Wenzhouxiangella limi]
MRILILVLIVLLAAVQLRFWQELSQVQELQAQLEQQQENNARLQARNDALAAEVDDLRRGQAAIEERARSELGLIRSGEEFFLVVDPETVEEVPRQTRENTDSDG